MSCGTLHFHKTFHHELMSKPTFQALDFEARGVLFTVRCLAGAANNNGGIRIGKDWVDLPGLVRWMVTTIPGSESKRIRKILVRLIDSGVIIRKSSGRLAVADWAFDHEKPPSAEAERQRKSRARRRYSSGPDEGRPSAGLGSVPASTSDSESDPGAPSASIPTERDMSRRENVTCHEESKIEEEEKTKNSDSIRPPPASSAGTDPRPAAPRPQPQPPPESGPAPRIDPYDRTADAVDLARRVCGERGAWSRNGFSLLRSEVGDEAFRCAVAEVQDARASGVVARKGWGALLHTAARRIRQEGA